jgi:hypothetical protein
MSRGSKSKVVKKSAFMEKEFFARMLSLNANFSTRESVGQFIEQFMKRQRLDLIGIANKRGQIVDLSFEDLTKVFPHDKEVLIKLLVEGDGQLEIGVLWFPSPVFDAFISPITRLEISLGFPKGWEYQRVEEIFCDAVSSVLPHWGELNQVAVTNFPTLCHLNCHRYCVPHLGTTNYFGEEYLEFFGGIERITSAGFQRTLPLCDGMLVSLGVDLSEETYKCLRSQVEARLAPPDCFHKDSSVNMPRFRIQ